MFLLQIQWSWKTLAPSERISSTHPPNKVNPFSKDFCPLFLLIFITLNDSNLRCTPCTTSWKLKAWSFLGKILLRTSWARPPWEYFNTWLSIGPVHTLHVSPQDFILHWVFVHSLHSLLRSFKLSLLRKWVWKWLYLCTSCTRVFRRETIETCRTSKVHSFNHEIHTCIQNTRRKKT